MQVNILAFHCMKYPNCILIKNIVIYFQQFCITIKSDSKRLFSASSSSRYPSYFTVSIAHRISASLTLCLKADLQNKMFTSIPPHYCTNWDKDQFYFVRKKLPFYILLLYKKGMGGKPLFYIMEKN